MTKFEVRAITMALLCVEEGDKLLDVGAGTGSISIEAALQGAEVYAIEQKQEAVELIRKNAEKFGVQIRIVQGFAPEAIERVGAFHKCFIGGSKGKLEEIVDTVHAKLASDGILAANFIKLENAVFFRQHLQRYGYNNIATRLIQSAVMDKLGLMKGQNPVFIVKGEKP